MSLEDLLREEVQKQIDITLKDIEHDYSKLTGPNVKSRWDFVYGYEYGCIITAVADYYRYKIVGTKGTAEEQVKYVADTIKEIVLDRLPEIRQAITRAEIKLKLCIYVTTLTHNSSNARKSNNNLRLTKLL